MDLPKIQYSKDEEDDEDEDSEDELDITDNEMGKNNKCDKSEFGISHIKVKYEEDEDDSDWLR